MAFFMVIMPFNQASGQESKYVSDSSSVAFLPAASYTTDVGLAIGGIFNRITYGTTIPFEQNIALTALLSTKGLVGFNLFLDQPTIFRQDDRLTLNFVTNRFLEDQYYGIDNRSVLDLSQQNHQYLYQSFTFKINIEYLFPLKEWLSPSGSRQTFKRSPTKIKSHDSNQANIQWIQSIDYHYKTPWGNDTTSYLMRDKPAGIQGSKGLWLGLGGIVDARNHEFYPTRGWYSKLLLKSTTPIISSPDYTQQLLTSEWRFYRSFHLFWDVVFAQRLYYEWSSSHDELPYWAYPELGGEDYLRGFATYRFLSNQVMASNTELRTWLFDFHDSGIRLGGTLFADIGSFSHSSFSSNEWEDNLRYTFGFGGLASFFSPDFILRADMGFSEEGFGIYFSTGILF